MSVADNYVTGIIHSEAVDALYCHQFAYLLVSPVAVCLLLRVGRFSRSNERGSD